MSVLDWPVVILCGGRGTRINDETVYKPKPMVEIGGKPILWHIMKIYAHYNFKKFILCLGYKGEIIKDYFLNYQTLNNDFTVKLGKKDINIHNGHPEIDWEVTLADTGLEAMTGARLKRIEKYIDADNFIVTYGDGLADINIGELAEFHQSHGKIGTITGIHYQSRFGHLGINENQVTEFNEKPTSNSKNEIISGGFFAFKRDFFKYIQEIDDCILEREPLQKLTTEGELMVYHHRGFWQCLDTLREKQLLDEMWDSGKARWKVWP